MVTFALGFKAREDSLTFLLRATPVDADKGKVVFKRTFLYYQKMLTLAFSVSVNNSKHTEKK